MSDLKVLLVDDEEELAKALAERLEIRGFGVEIAYNGEHALQSVRKKAPDVMVLDLRMPGIDGLEVLRRVRRSSPQVRVIILTGHGSESDREIALRLGAVEYLQKPVDIGDLVQSLHRAIQHRVQDTET